MGRTRTIIGVALLLVAAFAVGACSARTAGGPAVAPPRVTAPTVPAGTTIVEENIAFNPDSVAVAAGTIVTFRNDDHAAHHIVVGVDDLGIQQPGQTVTWTAPSSDAVYVVRCLIHPAMQGRITVGTGGPFIGMPGQGGQGGQGGSGGMRGPGGMGGGAPPAGGGNGGYNY